MMVNSPSSVLAIISLQGTAMCRRERLRGWKEGESSRWGSWAGFTHITTEAIPDPAALLWKVPQVANGCLCCLDGDHLLRSGKYFAIGLIHVPNMRGILSNIAVSEHLPVEVNTSSNTHNLLEGNGDYSCSGKRCLPMLRCWRWSYFFVSFILLIS